MKSIEFPLLLLTRRMQFRPITIGDGKKYAVAFSTLDKATAFMESAGESNWEFALLIRGGVNEAVNSFEAAGLYGLCVDPNPDETGGTGYSIAELRSSIK